MLESVDFTSTRDLESCLSQIRSRLGNPGCFERRTLHSGKFQFSLRDAGGKVVGKSGLYRSEAGMENGIKNTRYGLLDSNGIQP